jgi:ATP-dependent RNA helicase DeaD
LSIIQKEELEEIPEFENELGITINEFIKADVQSIEENNGLLWAKKIFKTKPNREVSEEFKTKIKTIFHHLTKEELVEKILANYLSSTNLVNTKPASKNKRQKQ